MRRLALLAALLAALPASAATVSMRKEGGVYRVAGRFQVNAVSSMAWNVITDYDDIGRFVSSIHKSRVVQRDGGSLVVEQQVRPKFLFVSRRIDITMVVRESPFSRVDFQQSGNAPFQLYEGRWEIVPDGARCAVSYDLAIAPGSAAGPHFLLTRSLRKNIARQLDEVRAEIERRAGVARASGALEARP